MLACLQGIHVPLIISREWLLLKGNLHQSLHCSSPLGRERFLGSLRVGCNAHTSQNQLQAGVELPKCTRAHNLSRSHKGAASMRSVLTFVKVV
jgi:hypothetical protein